MEKVSVLDLPLGTKFLVNNGQWCGQITEENGIKYIQVLGKNKRYYLTAELRDLNVTTNLAQIDVTKLNLHNANPNCSHDFHLNYLELQCSNCDGWSAPKIS